MPELRLPASPLGGRAPLLHAPLLLVGLWVGFVGGTVTFGSWGEFDARLAAAYFVPAVALHAWATARGGPMLAARGTAWALLLAMCVHTGVLLQPVLLVTLLLLAALDLAVHGRGAPRPRLPPGARVAAGLVVLGALGGLALLMAYARFEVLVRLGACVVLAAALAFAALRNPGLREPARLLPALGVYYLFFVLAAAPVLPVGPALAWWLLCGALLLGALVAARHVTGDAVPRDLGRHRHVVRALPDPHLGADAGGMARYLARGDGAEALAARLARARGVPEAPLAAALRGAPAGAAGRAQRERTLTEILGLTE